MLLDPDDSNGGTHLHGAIEALRSAARTPARNRQVPLSDVVEDVCRLASLAGLDEAAFHAVVDVVTVRSELDQPSVVALSRHLYPAERVSPEAVAVIVGALGQGVAKPAPAIQVELVKWLVNAREVVDAAALSRLYGLLFSLLDILNLRTQLCHLLSLITRRHHVRPFRIQQLLELSRTAGPEPALLGLLRVYKDYYPDIIVGTATSGRAATPQLNLEWRKRLFAIQEANATGASSVSSQHGGFKVLRRPKTRSAVVPEVHTLHAKERSVTLEEIDSAEDFVASLERVELPSQLVAVLADPLLQKYLTLRPSTAATARLNFWLGSCLETYRDSIQPGSGSTPQLEEILTEVLSYTRHTKTLLSMVEDFLADDSSWRYNYVNLELYLSLLSYLHIRPFKELQEVHLNRIESQLAAQPDGVHLLLNFYNMLTRNWTRELLTMPPDITPASSRLAAAFTDLVDHMSLLSLSVLTAPPSAQPPAPAVLTFYDTLVTLTELSDGRLPVYFIPPLTINLLLHDPSLSTLSRLCNILARQKHLLESRSRQQHPHSQPVPASLLARFNTHLMDTCNLLWRSRALIPDASTADAELASISGAGCPPATRAALQAHLQRLDSAHGLATAFDLSHHLAMSGFASAAMAELEAEKLALDGATGEEDDRSRHVGPATQRSLVALAEEGGVDVGWKEFRVRVLEWLEARGAVGPKMLMFATMKDLMNGPH